MPALANPRHERFALAIYAGLAADNRFERAASTAYRQAYPGCAQGNSAEAAASRLLRRVKPILERVRELQAEDVARLKPRIDFSRERVGRRLDKASAIAEEERNASAMATSELGIAKVFGHITDKREDVTNTFADAKSLQDIGRGLLQQVGHSAPSDDGTAAAIEANDVLIATLEAIRDRALATSQ